jgi:mannose-1-phosphate guanylyltransferase
VAKPIIVTGEEHRFLAAEQLREIGIDIGAALLEPAGKKDWLIHRWSIDYTYHVLKK